MSTFRFLPSLLGSAALVGALTASSPAEASPDSFGLGVIVGDPTGVTGATHLGSNMRLTFGVGLGPFRGEGLVGHVDWQWLFPLKSFQRANMSLYAGVGPAFALRDEKFRLGARAPVGLSFMFQRVPIEVFIEAAAKAWIIDRSSFGFDAAGGFRWWF
jgi:hypothetical protein